MKLRCERDLLAEALTTSGRAVSNRTGSLPVLSGLRLELAGERLQVTGTDLDLTITAHVDGIRGDGDGVVVLPSKLVSEIIRALEPGAVDLEVDGEEATISSGRSQFTVRTIPATEFPRLAEPGGDVVELDAAHLAEALRQVVAAASRDESRPILTGVLLAAEGDGLRLVATDSYRLAVRDLPGTSLLDEGQSVLVPSTALAELARLLGSADTMKIRLGERDAAFDLGRAQITTRLIEGEFPNYRNLIPASYPNRLRMSRERLHEAVKRVRVVAHEPSTPVKLEMTADGLNLSASAQDVGNAFEQLDAKYEGTELVVAFNPEYLMAGIEAATGDEITLESVDALKPAVIKALDSPEFLYLLMPVRVS